MRRFLYAGALTTGLALTAFAAPTLAQDDSPDRTPPTIKLAGDASPRCDGAITRLTVRIIDESPTRTLVRLDRRGLKSTTRKRFTLRLNLDKGKHVFKIVARDSAGNRFIRTHRVLPCP
jgi:hypothetical protein